MDAFTTAYIRTAFWSSSDDEGDPLDDNYGESDLAPATLKRMLADCAKFQADNAATLSAAIETGEVACGPDFDEDGRAGHDFWLTRNGHGAGFWDGGWPEPFAAALMQAAKRFDEADLYVGDDGRIYQFGAEG